ncbi:CAP domain-containing protein [Paenibacillus sp. JSM ZJ436]|uniref:CAP domain-containing protein n=1 Tax=Paenibacillus sp. JSM ZJ436 TaxID=3376190 RepID=UPI0037B3DB21
MRKHIMKKAAAGSLAAVLSVGLLFPSSASAASSTDRYAGLKQQIEQYLKSQGYGSFKWLVPGERVTQQPAPAPSQPEATKPSEPASPAPSQPEVPKQQPAAPVTTEQAAMEAKVVELVNQERTKAGLKSLTVHQELAAMALDKAKDMSSNNYFAHTSPTYGSPYDMMKAYGISYRYAGENIAKGQRTPEEVMKAWMNSEGHRKNILSPNFTMIGVGYYNGHWVQEFISQ